MQPGTDSPIGNFPDLAQAYSLSFARQRGQTQVTANQAQTQAQVGNQQTAIKQKIQELQSLTDPKAYTKVKKQDGGFDFIDPQGNKVDVATVTERTGTKATDWVADSENPIDVQYVNDYKNLQSFMDAVLSKDDAKVKQFTGTDPNLQQYTSGRGGIDRLLRDFKSAYGHYYTPQSVNPAGYVPGNAIIQTPQPKNSFGDLGVGGGGIPTGS